MTSVGVPVNNSNNYWKGADCIERKLGSVLDRKVTSSTKQVLLDRIQFKEASKPDTFYTELRNKYVPLNSSFNKQDSGDRKATLVNGKDELVCTDNSKDELPAPKFNLFEREKIQLRWKCMRRVGPGLFNLGNTCFLNSVIQVLTYTPPLVNYLATQEHSKICQTVGFCMLCELQRHVLRTFGHNQNEAIKPLAIIQKLKYIAKHLRFGHQEDSHEFLRYVIDGMLKSCLSGVPDKLDRYTKGTTMVHQVFGGYYRSQVTCERCQHTSNTYDPLMEILLDIKHAHSVVKALQRLISVELLNGDNMYLCPRCKRKVPAKKHLTVHRAPNVMTMCLKRFDCHSLFGTKVNKEVNYPESLNLRPFMSKSQGPAVNYKLYAVLVHSGYSCNSGHYYCFIKASNGCWYQMNDSMVRQVGLKAVLSQQAYLLFYIRDQFTPKEKSSHQQQQPKTASVNGVKTWKPEGLNSKQNIPKIINGPKKVEKEIGRPIPRHSEPSVKENNNSNSSLIPTATTLPQNRDKVSFTMNTTLPQKKPASSGGEHNKLGIGKSEERQNPTPKTTTSLDDHREQQSNLHGSERRTGEVEANVESCSVAVTIIREDEKTAEENEVTSAAEQHRGKDSNQTNHNNGELQATTKWKVTANLTVSGPATTVFLPGETAGCKGERTPSLSSDGSNVCSVACKTGEWNVSDRSAAQDLGPRLPERQHAGWKVSMREGSAPQQENDKERTIEKVDDDASRKKPKKRKHSKEKSEKYKYMKIDDEMPLLSEECREKSKDEGERKKQKKKSKKSKKLKKEKKRKSLSSGHDSPSSEGDKRRKRKNNGHKKSKKRKKGRRHDSEMKGHSSDDSELQLNSKGDGRKVGNYKKMAEKAKELVNISVIGKRKMKSDFEARRPLVQYSDHSSSSDESTDYSRKPMGSSRSTLGDSGDNGKNKTKSSGCEETSSSGSRCRDSNDRRHVVDVLLENSRGSSNYGCEVERWDGGRDEVRDKNVEGHGKRRHDQWDDEYDRGKVKRTKRTDNSRNGSHYGNNRFQREHDKKRMRNDGWHFSTSSSSSWRHNRSSDRHSRRDWR